jgi:hypothetical protein
MIALRLGTHGSEVRQIEQRLSELNLYRGPIDGAFGGGVQSAVKAFQRSHGLDPDGVIGPDTWAALFPGRQPPGEAELAKSPLTQRCMALTGTFETSIGAPDCYCGLVGNFDKQGISFGVLQWNLGQGTLQPMLSDMITAHGSVAATVFQDHLPAVVAMLAMPRPQQLQWAQSVQDVRRFTLFEPWNGMFKTLGRTPEFQAIQVRYAEGLRQTAVTMCRSFGLGSERALALMFDICVQNGAINRTTAATIRADFNTLAPADDSATEVAKMRIVANRRAEAASARFVEDVRVRKLTIANGEGNVHNVPYDLERQFGIRLVNFVE